jgi:hypothetical protein
MEKVVRKFKSHQEADQADRDYYLSLTPEERIRILMQLIEDFYGPQPRLERVFKIVKRAPR